jgi:peptidoglycan hydrolase CwlO-like protein
MSEITDLVMPILRRIQAEIGELKRDIGELKRKVDALENRMDKIESYITYSLGLISQNKADIDRQGRSLLEPARRVETLEQSP